MEIRTLAEKILELLHEQELKRGQVSVPVATLYKTFEKEVSYDSVQQAIKYLVERDLIAPFGYSLTAKGRREHGLRTKASSSS